MTDKNHNEFSWLLKEYWRDRGYSIEARETLGGITSSLVNGLPANPRPDLISVLVADTKAFLALRKRLAKDGAKKAAA